MVQEDQVHAQIPADLFASLLSGSQKFIRRLEESWSVSLRDVKRVICLRKFFLESLKSRPRRKDSNYPLKWRKLGFELYAIVLALGLGYQSRLYEQRERENYRLMISKIL